MLMNFMHIFPTYLLYKLTFFFPSVYTSVCLTL